MKRKNSNEGLNVGGVRYLFFRKVYTGPDLIDMFLIYSRVLGSWIFKQKKYKVKMSPLLVFHNLLLILITMLISFLEIKKEIKFQYDSNTFPNTNKFIAVGMHLSLACAFVLMSINQLLKNRKLCDLFEKISKVEHLSSRINFCLMSNSPTLLWNIVNVILIIFRLLIVCIFKSKSLSFIDLAFQLNLSWLSIAQFSSIFVVNIILHFVETHFNFLIQASRTMKEISLLPIIKTQSVLDIIQCHSSLHSLCEEINSIFGPQNLISSIILFVFLVFHPYQFIRIIIFDSYSVQLILLSVMWMLYTATNMYYLTLKYQNITKKAYEFDNIFFQLMVGGDDYVLCSNKKLELYIIMKKDISFSACGLYSLNNNLIHSMIAAALTYLILLIQFNI